MSVPDDPRPEVLDSQQLQERAISGAMWTMVHTVIAIPIAFMVNLLLARVLAPEGYGRLAVLTLLITIASSVLALGLTPAMVQFGAKAHSAGRPEEVRRILSASQGFRLLVVAPTLTIFVVLLIDVPWYLLALALVFGVWVPAFLDGAVITLLIENKSAAMAKIGLITTLAVQCGVVAAALSLGTADAIWSSRIVLSALAIGLALVSVAASYRSAVLRPRLPRGFPVGFWRFAVPTGLAGLIGTLALSRTEVLFLQWLSTPAEVGLFALAYGVSGHVFAPAQALTGPLVPAVSSLREVGPDRVPLAFERTLRASSTIAALLVAAGVPALTLLLPTLYGQDFREAAPAVLVLGVVGSLVVSTGPVSAFVLARLSARLFLVANVSALAVDVVLAIALIPAWGLWGAVLANVGGTLTRLGVLLLTETRFLGITAGATASALTPTALAAVASTAAWLASQRLPAPVLVQAVIAAIVSLALLILGMRMTRSGLASADVEAVARVLPGRFRVLARGALRPVTVR